MNLAKRNTCLKSRIPCEIANHETEETNEEEEEEEEGGGEGGGGYF